MTIHPYMALQPLPGLGLPHKTPPFIPVFSSSSPSSYPPAVVMHPSGPHLPIWFLVFPLVLWCRSFRLKPFFGILSSSTLIMCPAHSNLLILMCSMMFGSLCKHVTVKCIFLFYDSKHTFTSHISLPVI